MKSGFTRPTLRSHLYPKKLAKTTAAKVKRNVLANGLQLAGFEVTPTGRFWVTPEACPCIHRAYRCRLFTCTEAEQECLGTFMQRGTANSDLSFR